MSAEIAPCPHRPPCPGCPRYGHAGISADALRELQELASDAGGPHFEVVEGAGLGSRHRARLAVRGRAASPKIGIFQRGTHRIVDIPHCGIHHPQINRVATALKQAVRETGIAPYADRPHRGALRYVQVAVERRSRRAQVVLVGNGTTPDPLAATCDALAAALGDSLHSLWWNGNPDRTNSILGPHWQRLRGDEAVCERIGGVDVFFPPGAFGQSNLGLADALVERVASWIPDGERVVEFYAGCGAVGLGLLPRSRAVTFNEVSRHGLRGLELGIAARPAHERERAVVAGGSAGERLDLLPRAGAVIVDPPRKGLDAPLLEGLIAAPPTRMVYVSCDRASFASDARRLLRDGGFRLHELAAYALFPYSDHVEIAALFAPGDETPETASLSRYPPK